MPALVLAATPAKSSLPISSGVSSTTVVTPTTLPVDGKIANGSGQIHQDGATLTVTQQSQHLSLNWQSFDIGSQATVNFIQPGQSAIAVNRIADTNGSVIMGHLNANGQVFLINPNGVLFGQGAQVNVGGLVASTLDVDDNSLGNGSLVFSGNGHGSIINKGSITTAPGGYVALLGHQVSNQGWIRAQLGSVALAGGSAVTLSLDGDTLVDVKVDRSTVDALAQNGQLIQADGGQVWMTAGARDSLLASVVNNTGTVEAQTVGNHNGHVVLLAGMQDGTVNVGGTLDASAPSGGDGGAIETSAAHAHIADDAMITTRAAQGHSGNWLIDPNDFTIAASGGDETGAQLSNALANGNVTIASSSGTTGGTGSIYVNDAVNWNANTLTLNAADNININAVMTAGGTAVLALNPATANGSDAAVSGGAINAMPGSGRVDFTGTGNGLLINGSSYLLVSSAAALQAIGQSGNFALAGDIDASGIANFSPIGGDSDFGFSGVLEGLGHVVRNLHVNSNQAYVGFIGTLSGKVENLGLIDETLVSTYNGTNAFAFVGGMVGQDLGVTRNVFSTGTVTGSDHDSLLGGLVGALYGSSGGILENGYSAGLVTLPAHGYAGGLVGAIFEEGHPQDVYSTAAVIAQPGSDAAGGLVGTLVNSTITNAYSTGLVTGGIEHGGLVADLTGSSSVSNAYWDVLTSGQARDAAATGLSTIQLQAALPAGLSSPVWGIVPGKSYPYLLGQFTANAVPQVVAGKVYTDNGATTAGAGVTVSAQANGSSLASQTTGSAVQTGSNGYYYFLLAPNTLSSGDSVLVDAHNYGPSGSLNGATFLDAYTGGSWPSLDIDGGIFNVRTQSASWSRVVSDLAVAEGGGASASTALGNPDIGSIDNLQIVSAGDFTVDNNISASTLAVTAQGNIALNAPILATDTLQLVALGNITQTAPLQVTGDTSISGSSVTLTSIDNQFSGRVALSAQDANLTVLGNLSLGTSNITDALNVNSTGTLDLGEGLVGNLTASSFGAITQDGALTGGSVAIAVGADSIVLADAGNNFSGEVELATSGKSEVTFNNGAHSLLLGNINALVGTLNLQAANISQVNGTSIFAATLSGAATGTVNLGNENLVTALGNFSANGFTFNNSVGLTITGAVQGGSGVLVKSGDSLTLSSSARLTGDNVTLVDEGNFTNNAGAGALAANGGTWQIWSQNFTSDALGGLPYDFKQYNANFGSSASLGTGNGIFYAQAPVVTISSTGASAKVYDGSTFASPAQVTLTGLIPNDNAIFDFFGIRGFYGDANVGSGKQAIFNMGQLAFGDVNRGVPVYGYQYNSIFSATGAITPALLTITASSTSKVYDGHAYSGGSGVSYKGFVGNESPSVLDGVLSYGGDAQGAVNAGSYTIVPGGLASGNYDITFVPGQLQVTPAALTVITNNDRKIYDGLAYTGGNGVSYDGFVNGETSSVLGGTLGYGGGAQGATDAGSYAILANGLTSSNYTIDYQPGLLTVTPAPLIVVANNARKIYDGLGYAGGSGVTYSGFVNGETSSVVGGTIAYGGDAQGAVNTGYYMINASGLIASNYSIDYLPGQLSVTPAPLIVIANNARKVYDGLSYAGGSGVTYNGFVNGETSSVLGGTLGYGGDAQGAVNAGSYTIDAHGLTSSNYTIDYQPGQLTVTPAPLIVTANNAEKVYDGLSYTGGSGVTYSGFVNGETSSVLGGTLGYGGDAQGAVNAGSYAITPNGLVSGNYAISYTPGQLSVTPAPLVVSANGTSKVYDGLVYAGGNGISYSGFVNGETSSVLGGTLTYGGDAQTAVNVGNYAIAPGGLTSGNYAITFVPGQLAVTPAPLSVSVNAASKTYDAQAYTGGNGVSYAGFVDGQNASVLGGALVYGGNAEGAVGAGSYNLTAGGLVSGNYAIDYVPGTLTVSPAMLTYVASPLHMFDGQNPSGLNGTVIGFQGGDTLDNSTSGTLNWTTSATANSPAGQYAILGGGLSARNYVFDEATANDTALTIGLNGTPQNVGNAVAGVQGQIGLMTPSSTLSEQAAPARGNAPYAPDVQIVGDGMRLP
jgi:trimeric autotransporter adhesin